MYKLYGPIECCEIEIRTDFIQKIFWRILEDKRKNNK